MPRKSYYDRQPKRQKAYKTITPTEARRGGIISITATASLLNALNAYCIRENKNRSEYVRDLIADALAKHPELFDDSALEFDDTVRIDDDFDADDDLN